MLSEKDNQIEQLREEKEELLAEKYNSVAFKRNKKCFSTPIRLFAYNALVNNVSTENIPAMLPSFYQCFGLSVPRDIPHRPP